MASANKQKDNKSNRSFSWDRLTWDDLSEWADPRSLERGKTYQRQGRVKNLALLPCGGLVAEVVGTHMYATVVTTNGKGRRKIDKLQSTCSCPIGGECKHCIAVVLEYLESIDKGKEVACTDENDSRLHVLESYSSAAFFDETQWPDEDIEDFDDDLSDRSRKKQPKSAKGRKSKSKVTNTDIRKYLEKKSKQELVEFIEQAYKSNRQLKEKLVERVTIETGNFDSVIQQAKKELFSVTSEEAWYDPWKGVGNLPNYSNLKSKLQFLIEHDQFDAVVELGRELIDRGVSQVGTSNDEGETAWQVAECLSIVAPAIKKSSMTDTEKILFVIDSLIQDEFDLCEGIVSILDIKFGKDVWAAVAESLQQRLSDTVIEPDADEFWQSYYRGQLSGWVIHALEESDQFTTATEFCISEARSTGKYDRAVYRLINLKRYDEAKSLAEEGLEKTDQLSFGSIDHLQDALLEVAKKNNDHSVAVAIYAERFVDVPSISSLDNLLEAARQAKCEEQVREIAMAYLETGIAPHFQDKKKGSSRKKSSPAKSKKKTTGAVASKSKSGKRNPTIQAWPFPTPPGASLLSRRAGGFHVNPIPHFDVLIQLAIVQKDAKLVLHWYDSQIAWEAADGNDRFRGFKNEIAAAIAHDYPDRALEMYCTEADDLAATTETRNYPQAIAMLKEARKILRREKRAHEFQVILETFHQNHHRKRRLVEMLNSLSRKPIVSKKSTR